jgi:hypothetical protein
LKIHLIEEPLLQFAGGTHIDIRAGLTKFGAFEKGSAGLPVPIGVGIVGTHKTIEAVRTWLDAATDGLPSMERNLRELRPDFPGMSVFGTRIEVSDSMVRPISRQDLEASLGKQGAFADVVDLFLEHARDIAGRRGLHVIIIAPPAEVFALGDAPPATPDAPLDDGQGRPLRRYMHNFHDIFKAQALDLAVPCQLLRPDTYGGGRTRGKSASRPSLQDLSTRYWNFHTALFYKAGGVPWRLVRHSSELPTCFVGTSFFMSAEGDRLLTSVAQVFNERGEGLIVQGGNARIDRNDRTPHLSAEDAQKLLTNGLGTYRREHRTIPARVVVHKTSHFDAEELSGFKAAAREERVELLDLVWVRRAGTRLIRVGDAPASRGTALSYDSRSGLVYLKGTVPYFRTYPGMYVPRALEFSLDDGETTSLDLARELLDLSKLNFNNTQFDSGDPITVRAARRVGDILKHVQAGRKVESKFRYFT